MVKPRGLGRGLDILLGADVPPVAVRDAADTLPVDALTPGKYQPRGHMDAHALAQLAESIKTHGVMQPVLVRPLPGGGHEIVAGERRWRAARQAGLSHIPVTVREIADQQALAMALIENIQREDLNPIEEARGIQRLVDEFALTHQQAADAVGRSRSAVTNLLRLLQLESAVQDMLARGELEMGHARALLGLEAGRQTELARLVHARGLSVREAEKLAQQPAAPAPAAAEPVPTMWADAARELTERLGARVAIRTGRGGRARLTVDCSDAGQIERLLAALERAARG